MSRRRVSGREQPFVVRRSGIQGRGAFAVKAIAPGEAVIEYVGERVSWKEADRRYDDQAMDRHHTFLFAVSGRIAIDAAVGGNDARFINHSCEPNCEAVEDGGRIFIFALRAIARGEELTYDYAYARGNENGGGEEKFYACRCGAAKCRGTLLAPLKRSRFVRHAAARQPHAHLQPGTNATRPS